MKSCFLFSSFEPLPEHFLHGYCFSGADIIVGDEGYKEFLSKRSQVVPPGLDGSYVVLNSENGAKTIGTDFSGYSKIFYYSDDACWVASDSVLALAQLLARHGRPIRINESMLASWFMKNSFGNQLVSFQTCVNGVRLLPADKQLVITPNGLTIQDRPAELPPPSYEEALGEHIIQWTSRLNTILAQAEIRVRCDLSGGKDSRSNLGLLMSTGGSAWKERTHFFSNRSRKEDYRIASLLAKLHGFRLNSGGWQPPLQSAESTYRQWKYDCLGIYGPVYFPHTRLTSRSILLYGAGGESYRSFYPLISPEEFIDRHRNAFPREQWFREMKEQVLEDLNRLQGEMTMPVHPLILHYRNFRDRCHGGRATKSYLVAAPLASKLLSAAASLTSPEKLASGQLIVDLLFNLNPALSLLPYDDPKKSPSLSQLERLSRISLPANRPEIQGEVFGMRVTEDVVEPYDEKDAIRLMFEDFQDAVTHVKGLDFFPKEYLEGARRTLETALSNGRFDHAVAATEAAHVILAGELARL